jgi:hypothetical protein
MSRFGDVKVRDSGDAGNAAGSIKLADARAAAITVNNLWTTGDATLNIRSDRRRHAGYRDGGELHHSGGTPLSGAQNYTFSKTVATQNDIATLAANTTGSITCTTPRTST